MKLSDPQVRAELRRRGLSERVIAEALRLRDFSRHQLGLELHVGQLSFGARVLLRDRGSGTQAAYLTLMLASGNRAGKTLLMAVLIIYSCLLKLNRPQPEQGDDRGAAAWLKSEYHWYHFGIQQEVADLVYNDIIRLLSGSHEGQVGGCPLVEKLGAVADWDTKEYGDYRWVRFRPEVGGAQVHFRTTGEKALGSLGKDMHGLSFDEAGLERNLEFLIKEVFGFRRLGTGGQLIMFSTPSEDLGFSFPDQWALGDPSNPLRLQSWFSMRMSTRDNIGYGLDQEMFDRLVQDMDERTVMQNIEGLFLQAKAAYFNGANVERVFRNKLPERMAARRQTVYLQGLDPAKSHDSAWSIVLAVLGDPADPDRPHLVGVRADQRRGQKSTATVVDMALDAFNAYDVARLGSRCYTATDATGFGGKLFREALDEVVPNVYNVEFGGTSQRKKKLLGDLRTVIDSGKLHLPNHGIWKGVRRQLLGYKLEDRGIEQDAVMALVCAVYLLRRAPADGVPSIPFDLSGGDA
jgi:hypothetical protein